ncbi:MAG: hypothetical protein G01um101448_1050 [Parcubacteria group bacterium Gr01-1014_48]|nr:MAG: hypothetical protein Greene041614_1094 [Parcubacteria group bacterium Greene0416_14]TSC72057.1 MAG: hypothetical protein G01um101448_1050 [Parcubacteria group bacterium Gr01-1014_48]TSC99830.1 MAG: hypothetical protein Greene101415_1067 [Parcubacteria group bacterium Greene1014_15]TSD07151.1 MAG: hypothetical protein Greene07144_994 [Parcubacteria group bacterium Greene0714_4]
MSDREEKIQKLKDYFARRDDIVMAFLFGSQMRGEGQTHRKSDWDVAVYFISTIPGPAWENTDHIYSAEDTVWGQLCDLLETDDVDLLILNRAPAGIAETAILGLPLVIKNSSRYVSLMRVLSSAAEEYRDFVDSYHMVLERSRSLSSRDREDLIRTID